MEGPDIRSQTLPEGTYILWAPPARGLKGLLSFGRSSDGGERLKALARCARLRARPNPPLPPSARFPPPSDEVPPPVGPPQEPLRPAVSPLGGGGARRHPPACRLLGPGLLLPGRRRLPAGALRPGAGRGPGPVPRHAQRAPRAQHPHRLRLHRCAGTTVMRRRLAAMPPFAAPPCYPCCAPCCCLPPPAARLVSPTSQTATCIHSFPSHLHCRLAACPMPPLL